MTSTQYIYAIGLATAAFLVQVLRTYIAWREWRLRRGRLQRQYQKEQNRGMTPQESYEQFVKEVD